MDAHIEKLPKRYAAAGKSRYDVSVNFTRDFKSNIFAKFEVDEKYELDEVLGGGTYGLVCSATNKTNGEKVAIKKLEDIFRHPAYTERAMREVLIHSQITHPFIVGFKEIMRPVDNDSFNDIYIVMEMVKENLNQSITARLNRRKRQRSGATLDVKLIMNEVNRYADFCSHSNNYKDIAVILFIDTFILSFNVDIAYLDSRSTFLSSYFILLLENKFKNSLELTQFISINV
jgi:serine/threonine protein kinase